MSRPKGIPCSEETKKLISRLKTGKKLTEYHILRISEGKRGHFVSEDTKEKIRKAKIGLLASEESKRKRSIAMMGHIVSQETIEKIRESNQRYLVENILCKDSLYYNIRHYVLVNKILEYKCQECGMLPEWRGKNLTLILDHTNGLNNDNRKENLRWLCPNCNIQTNTYCGKNYGNGKTMRGKKKEIL